MTKDELMAKVESEAMADELTKILVSTGALQNSEGDLEKTAAWWQHALRGVVSGAKKVKDAVVAAPKAPLVGAGVGAVGGGVAGGSGERGSVGKGLAGAAIGGLAGGAGGVLAAKGAKAFMGSKAGKALSGKLTSAKNYALGEAGEGKIKYDKWVAGRAAAKAKKAAEKAAKKAAKGAAK